jgi:long-chain acyl-CoA synthetase
MTEPTAAEPTAAERTVVERLGDGDRVALLVPGSLAYVDAVMSLLVRGVFPVPLDPRLTSYELDRILAGIDPALVVRDSATLATLVDPDACRQMPRGRPIHVTSGTTGTPKGVYSGLLSPTDAAALVAEERDLWGFREDDVNLVLSPLHHSAPLRFATGTLLAGGRVVVPAPSFDPATVTAAIREHRPSTMFCVPAHLQRLFAHWDSEATAGVPDLTCFRLVAHAGAPCPPAVKRRVVDLFPDGSTWEFYGSTEGQFTACRSEEWLARPGTVGRARPGRRLRIAADGVIWCRVPAHARFEYWAAPEKTAEAWDGDWFTVGDLGRLDDDGYLYLSGRREDLIITGGVNVYPTEVENVLSEHPAVIDVAVYGVPDDRWGTRVCAAVVGDATADELADWTRERLSPPKRPKDYRFVDELPRTLTGKVRRLELTRDG